VCVILTHNFFRVGLHNGHFKPKKEVLPPQTRKVVKNRAGLSYKICGGSFLCMLSKVENIFVCVEQTGFVEEVVDK